ncbi:GNAT family N-acetyltransferase [Streptomyces sp. NPDC001880]
MTGLQCLSPSSAGVAGRIELCPDLVGQGHSDQTCGEWGRRPGPGLKHEPAVSPPVRRSWHGVTVRPLAREDARALAALGWTAAWIHASWDGPAGLAASGYGRAAFHKGRILAVACTYFRGSVYEDIACATVPDRRREHLARACVAGPCEDISARVRTASLSCSRGDRRTRLPAWTDGFRLQRGYDHCTTGMPTASRLPNPAHSPRAEDRI